jgi:virulence-associated protein VapD
VYAISFDLDTEQLKTLYGSSSSNNAYADIRRFLEKKGFEWKQGSVYFGDPSVDTVTCVLATQEMAREFDWFTSSVRDIRMLRIEENNDLDKPSGSEGVEAF